MTVQGLHFRHGSSGPELLDGIGFELAAGELAVLVGPSGCGKTSLLRLLLGTLTPSAGSLRIDGLTLAQAGHRGWRAVIAGVMQNEPPCDGSVAEHIGLLAGPLSRRRVADCVRRARIDAEIAALPEGLATPIGEIDEAQLTLLWPRILLARALYRRPQVLLWDDTGTMPPEAARPWWEALASLALTRIVVTHRPETIAGAGRVIVLGQGRIEQDLRR